MWQIAAVGRGPGTRLDRLRPPQNRLAARCPLWPETTTALRESLAKRPAPKDSADADLFFITRCGDGWAKDRAENPLSDLTAKLLRRLEIDGRKGLGFYTLRHTFRAIADEAKDQPAADFIMGHEVAHMSSVYREGVSDERLKAVADHVREWLFGTRESAEAACASAQYATPTVYNGSGRLNMR